MDSSTDTTGSSARAARLARSYGFAALPFLAALVMFAPRILHGGFVSDDWFNRITVFTTDWSDALHSVFVSPSPYRGLLGTYFYAYTQLLGSDPRWSFLWSISMVGLLGALIALLLWRCGMPRWAAAAVGVLGVIFPYSTITKLWFSAHFGHTSGALAVGGLLLAIHGFGRKNKFARIAVHAGALLLYAAALMIYEMPAPLILASGLFYFAALARDRREHDLLATLRERWRAIAARWACDLVLFGLWLLGAMNSPFRAASSSSGARLKAIGTDGLDTIAASFLPFLTQKSRYSQPVIYSGAWMDGWLTLTIIAAVVAVALAGIGTWFWRRSPQNARIAIWGCAALVSFAAAFWMWSVIFKANNYYRPLPFNSAGLRVNLMAGFAIASIIVCTAATLGAFAGKLAGPRRRWVEPAVIALLLLAVLGSDVRHNRAEIKIWNQASTLEKQVLAAIKDAFPAGKPPAHSTVLLLGVPTYIADDAEVFGAAWTFRAALRAVNMDPTLSGIVPGATLSVLCADRGMAPFGVRYWDPGEPVRHGPDGYVPYDRLYFYNYPERRLQLVGSRQNCQRLSDAAGLRRNVVGDELPAVGVMGS